MSENEQETPAFGVEDAHLPADSTDVAGVPIAPEPEPAPDVVTDDDDQADDPSAGQADVDVTQPNPYSGPLGYVGKFAGDGKAVTDSAAGDQLDQPADDQLDAGDPATGSPDTA